MTCKSIFLCTYC